MNSKETGEDRPNLYSQDIGLLFGETVNHISECLLLTDSAGVVKFVNPPFSKATGLPPEEVLGSRIFALLEMPHDAKVGRTILQTIQKQKIWSGYLRLQRKDGEPIEMHTRIIPKCLRPSETHLIVLFRDTSQEESLEKHFSLPQRLEALGTLSNGIAHHFNNTLASIMGQTELIASLAEGRVEIVERSKKILDAAYRGRDFVSQLKTFSAADDLGGMQTVDLKEILEEAILFVDSIRPRDVTMQSRLTDHPITVWADPEGLRQVFVNLFSNAFKAMEEGGGFLKIELKEGRKSFPVSGRETGYSPSPCAEISIEDTGRGIKDSISERIFEPYFTTGSLAESSGMGLAIVHGLVERHGGVISFQSEMGTGTTFRVWFPLPEKEIQEKPSQIHTPPQARKEHILLVDDEEFVLEAEKDLLLEIGYRVSATTDPNEAMNLLRKNPESFDLIMTDLTMPEVDGLELAAAAQGSGISTPVVLFSGVADNLDRNELEKAGVVGFLPKPCSLSELHRAIQDALNPQS